MVSLHQSTSNNLNIPPLVEIYILSHSGIFDEPNYLTWKVLLKKKNGVAGLNWVGQGIGVAFSFFFFQQT